MDLIPVTHIYNKRGGMPYHLLQERQCNLVIRIKLSNLKHQTVYHSVGWDGSIIHDHPKMCIVNQTRDRQYWDSCNAVFDKIYPRKYFSSWQISTVYKLRLWNRIHPEELERSKWVGSSKNSNARSTNGCGDMRDTGWINCTTPYTVLQELSEYLKQIFILTTARLVWCAPLC